MNRFYRPSAPRYTSQFVEESLPFDLMLQVGQQKMQQQANFASAVGEFQGLVAITPAGERTQRMAPKVRQYWMNRLNEWSSQNMDKYDSPQAISDIVRMRTEFQNDPDITLMRMDAEQGDKERQTMKTRMEMGDIDLNVNPQTGQVKQFNSSFDNADPKTGTRGMTDPYKGYDPLIKFQDVPKRALEEFKLVPTIKRTVPYLTKDKHPLTGEEIVKEVHRSINVTDPDKMEQSLNDMAQRGVQGNEDWSRYQNEYIKATTKRTWNQDEWKKYLKQFADQSVISEDEVRANWNWPAVKSESKSGSETETEQTGIRGLRTGIVSGIGETAMPTMKEIRRSSWDRNVNNPNQENWKIRALKSTLSQTIPGFDTMTPKQQKQEMKKAYQENASPTFYKYDYWGPDVEREVNSLMLGIPNEKGEVVSKGATPEILEGFTVYDLDEGDLIQSVKERGEYFKEGNTLRFVGARSRDDIASQIAPGTVYVASYDPKSKQSKMLAIQLPELAEKDKRDWNFYGNKRSPVTGIGDMFVMDVYSNGAAYRDISDPGTEGEWTNINSQTGSGLYIIPMTEHTTGDTIYKVYRDNPTETGFNDDTKASLVGTYKLSDYENMQDKTTGQKVDEIKLLQMQMIKDAYGK